MPAAIQLSPRLGNFGAASVPVGESKSGHTMGPSPFMTPPPRPVSPPIDEKNSNQCSKVDDLSNKNLHLVISITPFLKGLVNIERERYRRMTAILFRCYRFYCKETHSMDKEYRPCFHQDDRSSKISRQPLPSSQSPRPGMREKGKIPAPQHYHDQRQGSWI